MDFFFGPITVSEWFSPLGERIKRHDPLPYWPLINIWKLGNFGLTLKLKASSPAHKSEPYQLGDIAIDLREVSGQLSRLLQSGLDFSLPCWWMSSRKGLEGKKRPNDNIQRVKNWNFMQRPCLDFVDDLWWNVFSLSMDWASIWYCLYHVETNFAIKRLLTFQ